MSGVKNTTVSIRSNELTNLRNQANRATNLEAQNSILNRQNAALIQSQNDLQRRLNTMETHNRRLQANMDSCLQMAAIPHPAEFERYFNL